MPGIKGRSGRRDFYEQKALDELLELSIKTLKMYLRDEDFPPTMKAQIALALATRRVSNKSESVTRVTLDESEREIIDKYTQQLPSNRLDLITGTTANVIDVSLDDV